MQFSHSRVETYHSCPYKFKLRYLDKIKTIPADNADNALYLGTAMHTGIEKGVEAGIKEYYESFPVINDLHINESIKLEYLIPKVREVLPEGQYERMVASSHFIAFLDLLTPNDDGSYDMYDFKYSNNIDRYMESGQLHEYKYFLESTTPYKIRNMYFVFVPKVGIKQKKTEDLISFRKRIMEELESSEVIIRKVEFDYTKVVEFYEGVKTILEAKEFPKNPTYFCNWCEYQNYCMKGIDYMNLPSSERRNIEKIEKKVIWLYGSPFSGKTTLANDFPQPLMLNTDGNIKFVDAPYLAMRDDVKVEGRQTKRTLAWGIFKDTITELEKKDNEFKTIIVDLLEDMYEHCRVYMYGKLNIEHESDNSFKAWDMVRTEFLSTMKKLMNMDYENIILISHEDTSKDLTKKSGDKVTSIKPNIQEKTANKVAGMVDIVARVIADGDDRTLNFKSNEVIFGGGRLTVSDHVIPLNYDDFMKVFEEANQNAKNKKKQPAETSKTDGKSSRSGRRKTKDDAEEEKNFTEEVKEDKPEEVKVEETESKNDPKEEVKEEKTSRRSRRSKTDDEASGSTESKDKKAEDKPARRTRKSRSSE